MSVSIPERSDLRARCTRTGSTRAQRAFDRLDGALAHSSNINLPA
jgi:hypothetical protein